MCPAWQPRCAPAAGAISQGTPGKICSHDLECFNYTYGAKGGQDRGHNSLGTPGLPSDPSDMHEFSWSIPTHSAHLGHPSISIHSTSQLSWPLLKWSPSIFLALSFLGAWPTEICILTAKCTLCNSENCQTTLNASKQDQGQGTRWWWSLLLLPI